MSGPRLCSGIRDEKNCVLEDFVDVMAARKVNQLLAEKTLHSETNTGLRSRVNSCCIKAQSANLILESPVS